MTYRRKTSAKIARNRKLVFTFALKYLLLQNKELPIIMRNHFDLRSFQKKNYYKQTKNDYKPIIK